MFFRDGKGYYFRMEYKFQFLMDFLLGFIVYNDTTIGLKDLLLLKNKENSLKVNSHSQSYSI